MTDYQELIKRLRCQSECRGDCPMMDMELVEADHTHQVYEQRCAAHEAADAIEELTAQVKADRELIFAQQEKLLDIVPFKWVSVKERLPEDRQNCLCYSPHGTIRVLCFAKNLRQIDEYDFANKRRPGWFFCDSEYGYCEALEITHWMPMPEPPKEET